MERVWLLIGIARWSVMSVEPDDPTIHLVQDALKRITELEETVESMQTEVARLSLLAADLDDEDYKKLDREQRVGRVREYLFDRASNGGKQSLTYDDVIWKVFNGEPSADYAYTLMELAADADGFDLRTSTRPKRLVCDPVTAVESVAFSSANKTLPEQGVEI